MRIIEYCEKANSLVHVQYSLFNDEAVTCLHNVPNKQQTNSNQAKIHVDIQNIKINTFIDTIINTNVTCLHKLLYIKNKQQEK